MLNQQGLTAPVIQSVCGDPSVLGGVAVPEFMRRSEARREYLSFIEQTTGLKLLPTAA
ncbi:hypothetical protein ACLM45_12615 [Synechococcus sp. A10-1-5-9]|uniref:hypothetical protein n=1 Tax=Synechococcus sp. A10-1-5-9 TaxID=3392295 RepID=UPI0039ECB975